MLHIGFAETDITPKLGSQSPGGMQKRIFQKVHDPLKAVAMVIHSQEATVALVGIDSLFITSDTTARARDAIAKATKIPATHVLIGASHTHSGGPVATCFESEEDHTYTEMIADRIAEAVISAWSSLHTAEVGIGLGHEPSISFNRRFLMRDGKQATHPGKGNANMVHPAGPIDPDVGVLAARAPGGELLGLFVNFGCHSTVMSGSEFSADYTCFLRETLRRHYDRPHLPVGFLLGSAGDVTQVDNRRPGREFGEEWAKMFGLALGAEAIQAIGRMEWKADAVIKADRTIVPIPIRDDAEIDRHKPQSGLGSGEFAEKLYARERELLRKERNEHPEVACEVQAIRVGDLGIVTNGAEFFCRLGLDIKAASPFAYTWVVTLANQWIGYVATPSAYYSGGYEPRTARSAKLAPWAGQTLVETSLSTLAKIR